MAKMNSLKNNRFVIVSVICGLIIFMIGLSSFLSDEYESSCVIMRQRKESRSKLDISSFFSSSSISQNDIESLMAFTPVHSVLYDEIIFGNNFLKELMYSEFVFSDSDKPISLYEYILKKRSYRHLMFSSKEQIKNNKMDMSFLDGCFFTREEVLCSNYIKKHLSVSYLPKNSVSIISFRISDQNAAAEITMRVVDLLNNYLEQIRLEYANEYYQLAENRIIQSKDELNEASLSLALYEETHHGMLTRLSDVDRQRLLAQYSHAEDNHIQSTKYYINAYVNMMEDLPPVFIISQPTVPNRKHHIDMLTLILLSIIGGLTVGSLFIKPNKRNS